MLYIYISLNRRDISNVAIHNFESLYLLVSIVVVVAPAAAVAV